MIIYDKFIPENIALPNTKRMIVCDENGKKIGRIGLYRMTPENEKYKLYSFGALADCHLQSVVPQEHFRTALSYFNDVAKVAFTCVCGDMSNSGTDEQIEFYKWLIDTYSPNTPVCEVTGNHDVYGKTIGYEGLTSYGLHNLYYTFEQGNDLFIMFGNQEWYSGTTSEIFSETALQWLHQTLEANKDRRCFVFQHCPEFGACGMPYSVNPTSDLLNCTSGNVFLAMMKHYKNVIWFHGHTHLEYASQEDYDNMNIEVIGSGAKSIHLPASAYTRYWDSQTSTYITSDDKGEGAIVDVYHDYIVIKGREFQENEYVPIAQYCIDTTIQAVESKPYSYFTV